MFKETMVSLSHILKKKKKVGRGKKDRKECLPALVITVIGKNDTGCMSQCNWLIAKILSICRNNWFYLSQAKVIHFFVLLLLFDMCMSVWACVLFCFYPRKLQNCLRKKKMPSISCEWGIVLVLHKVWWRHWLS